MAEGPKATFLNMLDIFWSFNKSHCPAHRYPLTGAGRQQAGILNTQMLSWHIWAWEHFLGQRIKLMVAEMIASEGGAISCDT